jgi:hypothetical protein
MKNLKPTSSFLLLLLAATAGFKSTVSVRAQDSTNASQPIAQVKYIPQRKDDIAWENDRIAHRIYGPALEVSEPTGSGIDVWVKSVRYPVIDKWYKGNNYHKDQGEGLDFYSVGKSRGCGGLGVWDGKALSVSGHWKSYEIKETGGDRTVFVVKYGPWKLPDGHEVSESRTFTLEKGSNLTRMESVFSSDLPELTIGIGIAKRATGKKTVGEFFKNPEKGVMAYWQSENIDHGLIGLGVVIDPKRIAGFAEDKLNYLVLVKVKPGEPLMYRSGACWSRGLDFHSFDEWKSYLEKEAGANK